MQQHDSQEGMTGGRNWWANAALRHTTCHMSEHAVSKSTQGDTVLPEPNPGGPRGPGGPGGPVGPSLP